MARLTAGRPTAGLNRARLYLLLCGASFLATTLVCVWLEPSDVLSHDGLSFYGNFQKTIVPYGLGLVASAYFLLQACRTMQGSVAHSFRVGLEVVAVGTLGLVATPSLSHILVVQDLHVLFGFAVFATQAVLSVHYLSQTAHPAFDWALLGLQLVAIGLAGLSFHTIAVLDIMLPAQVLAVVAFGALLVRAVGRDDGL